MRNIQIANGLHYTLAVSVFLKASASDLSGLGKQRPMMSDIVFPTMLVFLNLSADLFDI